MFGLENLKKNHGKENRKDKHNERKKNEGKIK